MFDVGFAELMLLFVIGLLVLGPQRLPKVAAQIGKWIGRARRTATELRRQLEREIELAEQAEKTEKAEKSQPTPSVPPEPVPAPVIATPEQTALSASDELSATANAMGGTPQNAADAAHAAAALARAAHEPDLATLAAPSGAVAPDATPAPATGNVEPNHGR